MQTRKYTTSSINSRAQLSISLCSIYTRISNRYFFPDYKLQDAGPLLKKFKRSISIIPSMFPSPWTTGADVESIDAFRFRDTCLGHESRRNAKLVSDGRISGDRLLSPSKTVDRHATTRWISTEKLSHPSASSFVTRTHAIHIHIHTETSTYILETVFHRARPVD